MRPTTLCYLERGDQYLMLHRTKKENDLNHDKWIGVGGGIEPGETPEQGLLREVFEETGLHLTRYRRRGVIDFVSDTWEDEQMHLYTADAWTGKMIECDEGDLEWIGKAQLAALQQWEGDKIFLRLMELRVPFFSLKLVYEGDRLTDAVLNGERIR